MGAFVFLVLVPAKLILPQCIVMKEAKLYVSRIACQVKIFRPEEQNEPVF